MPSTSVVAATGTLRRRVGDGAVCTVGVGGAAVAAGAPATVGAAGTAAACSAWPNCAMVPNRSATTGESAFRIAWSAPSGRLVRTVRALGAGSVRRRTSIAWVVAPVKGGSPASIS